MSLRLRLSLLVALITLLVMAVFAASAYWLFVRGQTQQLELLLLRDLNRAQTLFTNPAVGVSLTTLSQGDFQQQFVLASGVVTIPPNTAEALPLFNTPTRTTVAGVPVLVASLPWQTSSGATLGTIRTALTITDALTARRTLARSMLLSSLVISVTALLAGLLVLRRALAPLVKLAATAKAIDASTPQLARYEGPPDEVADVANALNAALTRVRERQAAERNSLAEIAHELAAPLTLVSGHLNALSKRRDEPELKVAKDAADELLYTSQDLLTLARGELERPLDLRVVALNEVVSRVVAAYPGVTVEMKDVARLAGSPERLTQLVRNLVRNAVQATGDARQVSLRLEPGISHRLFVEDTGPGIPAADLPLLFDRFFTKSGGVGVGLSVAKRIAEQHGGDITVTSTVGQGTVFCVSLPSLAAQTA